MDTFKRVRTILAKILTVNPNEVTPDALLINDLGADSLAMVEITMAVEEEFDIKIEDEEAMALETVEQVIRCIEGKTGVGTTRELELTVAEMKIEEMKVEALR